MSKTTTVGAVHDAGRLESASATSLALTDEGQERLFADVERYAQDVVLRPADVSNHPGLIDQFDVIGVNNAIEFDIYGNVNSTHVGGSADFNSCRPVKRSPFPTHSLRSFLKEREERTQIVKTGRIVGVTVHDGPQTVREDWRANGATVRFSTWTGRSQPTPKDGPTKRT